MYRVIQLGVRSSGCGCARLRLCTSALPSHKESRKSVPSPNVIEQSTLSVDPAPDQESLKRSLKLLQGRSDNVLDEHSISSLLSRLNDDDLKILRCNRTESDIYLTQRVSEFNQELLAYIQICLHRRKERLVERAIKHYSIKPEVGKVRWKYLNSPGPINELMKMYATKTDRYKSITYLFRLMRELDIRPDISSFAAVLVSQGRQEVPNTNVIKSVMADLQRDNDPEDLARVPWLDNKSISAMFKALTCGGFKVAGISKYFTALNSPNKFSVDCKFLKTIDEQIRNEEVGFVAIPCLTSKGFVGDDSKAQQMEKLFRSQLTAALLSNKDQLRKSATAPKEAYILPILDTFSVDDFVEMMIHVMKGVLLESKLYSPSVRNVAFQLGNYIHHRFLVALKQRTDYKDQILDVYKCFVSSQEHSRNLTLSEQWQQCQATTNTIVPTIGVCWPNNFRVKLGQHLLDIMIDSLKFRYGRSNSLVQALDRVEDSVDGRIESQVKVNPELVDIFEPSLNKQPFMLHCTLMPSLVPPVPWTHEFKGGLLLSQLSLVRTFVPKRLESSPEKIMDALNVVSSVPWQVNARVLDVILKLFKSGGDDKLDVPCCPPAPSKEEMPPIPRGCTPDEKRNILRARALIRKNRAEMYSLWCNENYRLSIANYLRGRTFWLPHNLDFRGRAYTAAPYFNHMGNDISRSLMLFARGKRLGQNGLRWLKIHFVNLTEHKKSCSLDEREDYANEKMDEIFDSALHPLEGRGFWKTAEKPWQALACAMELYNAINSPNPEEFVSHFPIHQDGSCNVLQHYAALGRDKIGAEMVNLIASDRPNDVYTAVAELVEQERMLDEQNQVKIAELLRGIVSRKVIKQTVMTTVYGVTEYGAKKQINKQLTEKGYSEEHILEASAYLTKKTFNSIRKMFTSAREIQDWLTDSAKMMCKLTGQTVQWTTPLGFVVSQPYYKSKQDKQLNKFIWVVDGRKQSTAIPPNFIHSLDSSHMMMTALSCYRHGLDFVSVHDSYWTHPCDVNVLGRICREEFVKLHQQPILENLSSEWLQLLQSRTCISEQKTLDRKQKHALWMLQEQLRNPPPPKGSLDVEQVLQSPYFFS